MAKKKVTKKARRGAGNSRDALEQQAAERAYRISLGLPETTTSASYTTTFEVKPITRYRVTRVRDGGKWSMCGGPAVAECETQKQAEAVAQALAYDESAS